MPRKEPGKFPFPRNGQKTAQKQKKRKIFLDNKKQVKYILYQKHFFTNLLWGAGLYLLSASPPVFS